MNIIYYLYILNQMKEKLIWSTYIIAVGQILLERVDHMKFRLKT
jgi:hypothetical protein